MKFSIDQGNDEIPCSQQLAQECMRVALKQKAMIDLVEEGIALK